MRVRPRDPAAVKVDALKLAERKASEGCVSCAEQYLRLAQANGATEAELDAAANHRLTRRALLKGGFAAGGLLAAWTVLPNRSAAALTKPRAASTSASTSTPDVVWFSGVIDGRRELAAVDSNGNVVKLISTDGVASVQLSGGVLAVIESVSTGAEVQSMLTVYDASTGDETLQLTGRSLTLTDRADSDALLAALSDDGRSAAILHSLPSSHGAPVDKDGFSFSPVTSRALTLELFDLDSGSSVDALLLGDDIGFSPGGDLFFETGSAAEVWALVPVRFADEDTAFQTTVVDSKLVLERSGTLPSGSAITLDRSFVAPDRMIRTLCTGETQWLDLDSGGLLGSVPGPSASVGAKAYTSASAYLHGGPGAIVANAATGYVEMLDGDSMTVTSTVHLPDPMIGSQDANPAVGKSSAVTSPDDERLFVVEGRGTQGGVWIVSVPDLNIIDFWAQGYVMTDLSVSTAGDFLFGVDSSAGTVTVIDTSTGAVVGESPPIG